MGIYGEFVASQRADVGIGPYRDCAYPGLLCKKMAAIVLSKPFLGGTHA